MARIAYAGEDYPLPLLVQRGAALLMSNVPKNGVYFGCFSGGKDSIVIKELARLANVPVEWHYHMTTVDPPELLRFIRQHHPDVIWDRPRHGALFRRIEHKGLPTRFVRWCCDEYKEVLGPKGCTKILGVRIAESTGRAKRYTTCTRPKPAKRTEVYPIRLWSDAHIWQFIRERGLPYCSLYDEGWSRLGCIGCPLPHNTRRREFDRWPGYEKQWRKSAIRFWKKRAAYRKPDGSLWGVNDMFKSGEEYWDWWMADMTYKKWKHQQAQLSLTLTTEKEKPPKAGGLTDQRSTRSQEQCTSNGDEPATTENEHTKGE